MKAIDKSKMTAYYDEFAKAQKAEETRRKAEHTLCVGRAVRSSRLAETQWAK